MSGGVGVAARMPPAVRFLGAPAAGYGSEADGLPPLPLCSLARRGPVPNPGSRSVTTSSFSSESVSGGEIVWSRGDVSGDATFAFTNLYQSGAPQEAVKVTADAAFGALATWLSEQQRLVERAFEARVAACAAAACDLPARPC